MVTNQHPYSSRKPLLPGIQLDAALRHTGPVMTLADFVVQVPTSCGSMAMAEIVEKRDTLAASSDLNEGEAITMVFERKSDEEHKVQLGHDQRRASPVDYF